MNRSWFRLFAPALLGILGIVQVVAAETTVEQKRAFTSIQKHVVDAGNLYNQQKFEDAASAIAAATDQLNELIESSAPEIYDALQPTIGRISKAYTMLELEGVSLPPLIISPRPTSAPAETSMAKTTKPISRPKRPEKPKPEPTPMPQANGVSFTSAVVPILVGRCGQCHVTGNKGGFQMTSYESLMKGPAEGVVVFPGDVIASRLVETIESGDMPRGGNKVPPNELMLLKTWIAQGAKFDGPDPSVSFSGAVTAAAAVPDAPMVRRATGNETVSFASDIAPLLVENCNGCHIDAMQTRGGLRMDTFAQLLRGGDSGAVVEPGKGAASLLVRKLRGSEGDRMPAGGRPALADDSIELISKWIDEGATLDGASENQPLAVMSQLAWASQATASQVSERRKQLAGDHLALANAAKAPIEELQTDHFQVLGTSSAGTLKLVTEQAEELLKQTRTLVPGPDGESYYRGRATIFVLPKRYDYSEFAKMVEQRGIPAEWQSHWQYDGIDAYVALVATERDEPEAIASRLLTPITALAVATRSGDVPRWFAEGLGVAMSARGRTLDREARRELEAQIYESTAAMKEAKQFLEGKLTPEQADRIGAALATTMIDRTRRRQFDGLLRELDSGTPFATAFTKSFGVNESDYINAWLRMVRGG